MKQKILTVALAAGLCVSLQGRVRAQSSDAAFGAAVAQATADAGSAQKALRAKAALAVVPADAGAARDFTIASNDSNAPEIYQELLSQGAKPDCQGQSVAVGGETQTLTACRVAGALGRITVKRNEILWSSTQIVDTVGDVSCRQQWIAQAAPPRPSRAELWYFCSFRGAVVSPSQP